jgi:uncharacterized ion transporter superfamily protein YfcC
MVLGVILAIYFIIRYAQHLKAEDQSNVSFEYGKTSMDNQQAKDEAQKLMSTSPPVSPTNAN